MKVSLKDIQRKEKKDKIELSDAVFDRKIDKDILARVVNWQLAKRQSGLHKVKERGEITGSTKKPFRQKGTGSARQGDKKVSQLRGGGVVHGPRVRSHAHKLQNKVVKLGLAMALSSLDKDSLHIVDHFEMKDHKTKAAAISFPKENGKSLIVCSGDIDQNFKRATRNLYWVNILNVNGLNVYDILRHDHVYIEKNALEAIEERFKS